MFGRLKDWWRVATQYNRCPKIFLSAIALAVTVYNADGFMEPNDQDAYNLNNVTAEPNDDGSFTIYFGGCDDGRVNCLPTPTGWNLLYRLYQPGDEILSGRWELPALEPAN